MAYHSNGYMGSERDHDHDDRSVDGSGKPLYLMEHLATFTVTKDTGIVYPADGMRRLLQLEKSNGIWSQKMQLCLDHPWVLIMDYETGNVIERFPGSLIQEPTAFTSHDPMEIYNNILVFIVGSSGAGQNPNPEMHIFQCQSISAQDLVEDLKQLRAGKSVSGHKSNSIPPPPAKSPPHPPGIVSLHRDREQQVYNTYRETDSELAGINDETSSTTSEKYERDVTILNHCFDDIEKFIARLQHAAAASRELERRRRNRKSKKKDLGDGMLTMRTKPPPEKEFIEIFQKFKLSFNLLAKLKAHIHDPNAPELIHFLFTPLALIVDASHDTDYDPNLPAKVVSPLLTREAVNLLMNCVTSKETELWHSLGNSWLLPRDQWKGNVPSYHPLFMDGWSPDYPLADEPESALEPKPSRDSHRDLHYNSDYFDYEQPASESNRLMYDKRSNEPSHGDMREPKMEPIMVPERELPPNIRDMGARSDISVDSIERSGHDQEGWLGELQSQGANIVQVTYPRTANNDKELTVVRGEFLEILDDSRKWWKARNSRGQMAHVPHTIVAPYHYGNVPNVNDSNDIFNNPLYTQNYNRNLRDSPSEPYGGGQSPGMPDNHGPPAPPADWVIKERLVPPPPMPSGNVPPPPPPMPSGNIPPPQPQWDQIDKNVNDRTMKRAEMNISNSQMNEELKNVLTLFRQKKTHNWDVLKTPEVFIKQTSTPDEVQTWLQQKGFSEAIQKQMNGMCGHEILGFSKDQLDKCFGPIEAKRLASQITLQKEVCGFTVGRNSELKAILEKARMKAEH